MKAYKITSEAGLDMGIYMGESAEDAIRSMIIDAGYTSEEDIAEQMAVGDIEAEEIDHL